MTTAQIRPARQARKFSVYRLAVRTGLHPNTIALAERGVASPETLRRIAEAFEAPTAGDATSAPTGSR